jgi:inositol oxygenase
MNESDKKALEAVRSFNPYDLYSKSDDRVDVDAVKDYYQGLITKYFNEIIEW